MEKKDKADNSSKESTGNTNPENKDNEKFPGYPHYPASEDIFNNEKEIDQDIEDLANGRQQEQLPLEGNRKRFSEDMTGEDLDVPGNKADEAKNNAGSEDEENNYYSLGGDNHEDLEEDNG